MYAESQRWVEPCKVCQAVNIPVGQGTIGQIHTMGADYPGQKWIMDTLLVSQADSGKRYLMVAHEVCTKAWELKAFKQDIPESTARMMCSRIFPRWGMAEIVRTDRGPEFNAEVARECMRILCADHRLGASGHPQFSGQVERGPYNFVFSSEVLCRSSTGLGQVPGRIACGIEHECCYKHG